MILHLQINYKTDHFSVTRACIERNASYLPSPFTLNVGRCCCINHVTAIDSSSSSEYAFSYTQQHNTGHNLHLTLFICSLCIIHKTIIVQSSISVFTVENCGTQCKISSSSKPPSSVIDEWSLLSINCEYNTSLELPLAD